MGPVISAWIKSFSTVFGFETLLEVEGSPLVSDFALPKVSWFSKSKQLNIDHGEVQGIFQ